MPTIRAIEYDKCFELLEKDGTRMTVHSVFTHAVNLEKGGEILSVVARRSYRAPHTATVPEETDFSQVTSFVGMAVRMLNHKILVAPDYTIALPPNCSFTPQSASIPTEASRVVCLKTFDRLVEHLPATGGCMDGYRKRFLNAEIDGDSIDKAVSIRVNQLLEAIFEHRDLERSVRNVIGAGKGLTPSGDDFLCGFLAMLGANAREQALRQDIVNAIESFDLARKTTSVSRQMLLDACKRHHPSPQSRLIDAFSGGQEDMRSALINISEVGHTSGLDFAAGAATVANLFQ